jgi:thiol-disulfide isomerase/thioredoxin
MYIPTRSRTSLVALFLIGLLILPACGVPTPLAKSIPVADSATIAPTPSTPPDWFNIKMTDVLTGQTFSMNDFSGKVVLVETMAQWCITCIEQQIEVKKMQALAGGSKDLVHVSLDTDLNEDAASLKDYANSYGFDWYFAISPLEADRAFANLYTPEFMNPPLAPMLFIDRQSGVHSLPYGLKRANALQNTLAPYLTP